MSRVWSSATRTCSSRRSASGSPSPRRSGTCSRRYSCWRPCDRSALHAALAATVADARRPGSVADVDPAGRRHEIWPIPAGTRRDELLDLAGTGELVVADGNHRSLAAQIGELRRFLAVVTTPESVAIQPYNRLINDAAAGGSPSWSTAAGRDGATVDRRSAAAPGIPTKGTITVYAGPAPWPVELPADRGRQRG